MHTFDPLWLIFWIFEFCGGRNFSGKHRSDLHFLLWNFKHYFLGREFTGFSFYKNMPWCFQWKIMKWVRFFFSIEKFVDYFGIHQQNCLQSMLFFFLFSLFVCHHLVWDRPHACVVKSQPIFFDVLIYMVKLRCNSVWVYVRVREMRISCRFNRGMKFHSYFNSLTKNSANFWIISYYTHSN